MHELEAQPFRDYVYASIFLVAFPFTDLRSKGGSTQKKRSAVKALRRLEDKYESDPFRPLSRLVGSQSLLHAGRQDRRRRYHNDWRRRRFHCRSEVMDELSQLRMGTMLKQDFQRAVLASRRDVDAFAAVANQARNHTDRYLVVSDHWLDRPRMV